MRSVAIYLFLTTMLALGACGGDDQKPSTTAKPTARESLNALDLPRDARITVTLKGRAYHPAYIIGRPGQTLVFKNEDDVNHRIRSRFGAPWHSGLLAPGDTYEVRMEREGAAMGIDFICTLHPKQMYGAVTWPG